MPLHLTTERKNKKKIKRETQVLGPCLRMKKAVEHEGDYDTNYDWQTWNGPQMLGKGTGRIGNQSSNQDHLDYRIVEID